MRGNSHVRFLGGRGRVKAGHDHEGHAAEHRDGGSQRLQALTFAQSPVFWRLPS